MQNYADKIILSDSVGSYLQLRKSNRKNGGSSWTKMHQDLYAINHTYQKIPKKDKVLFKMNIYFFFCNKLKTWNQDKNYFGQTSF